MAAITFGADLRGSACDRSVWPLFSVLLIRESPEFAVVTYQLPILKSWYMRMCLECATCTGLYS